MASQTFTVATSVQDPLLAEQLVEALRERSLDAFSRAGGAASTAAFAAASAAFWDIFVPSESITDAKAIIREVVEDLERNAEANSQAAEEEALSGEHPVAD